MLKSKSDHQLVLHHLECALGHLDRVATIDPDLAEAPSLTFRARALLEAEAEAIADFIKLMYQTKKLEELLQ